MSEQVERWAGGAAGFAFAAMWVAEGFLPALLCLLAAGAGAGLVLAVRRSVPALILRELRRLVGRARALAAQSQTTHRRRPERRPRPRPRPQLAFDPPSTPTAESTYGW